MKNEAVEKIIFVSLLNSYVFLRKNEDASLEETWKEDE